MQILTTDRFFEIVLQSAGGNSPLEPADLDRTFDDLDYDSLALLETLGQIERRYGVSLPDDIIVEATNLREMLELVNGHLASVASE